MAESLAWRGRGRPAAVVVCPQPPKRGRTHGGRAHLGRAARRSGGAASGKGSPGKEAGGKGGDEKAARPVDRSLVAQRASWDALLAAFEAYEPEKDDKDKTRLLALGAGVRVHWKTFYAGREKGASKEERGYGSRMGQWLEKVAAAPKKLLPFVLKLQRQLRGEEKPAAFDDLAVGFETGGGTGKEAGDIGMYAECLIQRLGGVSIIQSGGRKGRVLQMEKESQFRRNATLPRFAVSILCTPFSSSGDRPQGIVRLKIRDQARGGAQLFGYGTSVPLQKDEHESPEEDRAWKELGEMMGRDIHAVVLRAARKG